MNAPDSRGKSLDTRGRPPEERREPPAAGSPTARGEPDDGQDDLPELDPADIVSPTEVKPPTEEVIPMLTEVVQVPRYDSEELPKTLADVDWGDLAQRVRENVLERLLRRSDALLDAQLQNSLAPVLERAAESIAIEMHDALNRMVRDIVARAVTEELTRLHAEIARRNRNDTARR